MAFKPPFLLNKRHRVARFGFTPVGSPAAPTGIVGTNLACGHPGGSSPIVTSSVSIAANALILVSVNTLDSTTARTVSSISGAGLTWTSVAFQSTTGSAGGTERINTTVFKAVSSSATSGALTITLSGTANVDASYSVDQFTGIDTSNPIVQSSTRTATAEVGVAGETLALSSAATSGNATYGAGLARVDIFSGTMSAGTGYTSLCGNSGTVSTGGFYSRSEWRSDGQQNVTWTYTGSAGQGVYAFSGIGVEIKAAAVAAEFIPSNRTISQQYYVAPEWPYAFVGAAQPYTPLRQPPSLITVDNPPFQHRGKITTNRAIAVGQWQPPAWPFVFFGAGQPYTPARATPSLIAVAVNDPPFGYPSKQIALSVVAQGWQPPAWPFVFMGGRQPYMPGLLQPGTLTVGVDDPPFGYPSKQVNLSLVGRLWLPPDWPFVFSGGAQPYTPSRLLPTFLNVIVDDPPFQHPGRTALEQLVIAWQWQPAIWPPSFIGGLQPYAPRTGAPSLIGIQPQDPPFGYPRSQVRLSLAVRAWDPPDWPFVFEGGRQPYMAGLLSPVLLNIPINNPPFRHPSKLTSTFTAIFQWQPPSWPYVFIGGTGPYVQHNLSPFILSVTPIIAKEVRNVILRCRLVYGPR